MGASGESHGGPGARVSGQHGREIFSASAGRGLSRIAAIGRAGDDGKHGEADSVVVRKSDGKGFSSRSGLNRGA